MSCRIRLISSCDGSGFGARPLVDIGGGEHPFPVAEQVVEVGVQVGEVGDVGAEVVAADAAEPVGAGVPAGCDVGRLGAGAVGHGDLADGAAGVLGVEQRLGIAPDAVAVPVELQRGDLVDGLAAAVGLRRGSSRRVVSRLRWSISSREHVDRDPGVGVPLGVGVPVGVGDDAGLVELGAVGAQQRGRLVIHSRCRAPKDHYGERPRGRAGWRMRRAAASARPAACPGTSRGPGPSGRRSARRWPGRSGAAAPGGRTCG